MSKDVQTRRTWPDVFRGMVEKRRTEIWQTRAACLKAEEPVYFKKAMIYILGEDLLQPLLATTVGKKSILDCLINACQLGLEFGGQYPQAYILPFKKRVDGKYVQVATLIPTAIGFKSVALSDPPIIKSIKSAFVCENETCSIDYETGSVKHGFNVIKHGGDRGEILGFYAVVVDLDDNQIVTYMSVKDVNKVRDNTPIYKAGGKSSAWMNFYPDMGLKTVTKKALKAFVPNKDALARLYKQDENQEPVEPAVMTSEQAEDYKTKPIEERVMSQLHDEEKDEFPPAETIQGDGEEIAEDESPPEQADIF